MPGFQTFYDVGAAQHRGSILASNPAAPGSIFGVPEILLRFIGTGNRKVVICLKILIEPI